MSWLSTLMEILHGINFWSVTFRVFLAAIIGGLIGIDRGRHGRAAGTRTHVLVCLGASITTLLGFYTASCLHFPNDPLRMGAQVVSGIGFLGVGTIMIRNHSHVKGLTTAAGLWTTACIGLAIGAGFYTLALLAFLAVLFTFTLLSRLERQLGNRGSAAYYVEITDIQHAKDFCNEVGALLSEIEIVPAKSGLPHHIGMEIAIDKPAKNQAMVTRLQQNEHVAIAVPRHT